MYISKDFKLEVFVHQGLMCDTSVPFICLSNVYNKPYGAFKKCIGVVSYLSTVHCAQCFSVHFVVDTSHMIVLFVLPASYSQYKSEDGTASSATRPSSSGSGQTYTPTLTPTPTPTPTPSRTTTSNSPSNVAATKTGKSHQCTGKYFSHVKRKLPPLVFQLHCIIVYSAVQLLFVL